MRGLAPQKSQLWSMRMLDPEGAAVMGDALAETGRGLVASQYGGEKRSFCRGRSGVLCRALGREANTASKGGANRRKASTGEKIHT